MSNLPLTIACWDYDRTRAIMDGRVKVEGCDVNYLPLAVEETFFRAFKSAEFDACELSFSTYLLSLSRERDFGIPLPYRAVPAFVSRVFRHSGIYIRTDRGIRSPADLKGKVVGVPEYQMTAAVWARGMLQHEYGVKPTDMHWVTGGLKDAGRKPMMAVTVPGLDIRHEEKKALNDMLVSGELDAMIAPQLHPAIRAGTGEVAYLFPDPAKAAREYYAKTKLFPLMHVVVLRRDVYEQHPWVAVSLYQAFCQAKDNALARLEVEEPPPVSLPWLYNYSEGIRELFGRDYWHYGIEPNRRELEALCAYVVEQGLTAVHLKPEELFAPSVIKLADYRL